VKLARAGVANLIGSVGTRLHDPRIGPQLELSRGGAAAKESTAKERAALSRVKCGEAPSGGQNDPQFRGTTLLAEWQRRGYPAGIAQSPSLCSESEHNVSG
jgi:hypothetical protein